MPRMTRTQVTLEEDEYLFLKAQAAESGRSLSSVVRGLVRAQMNGVPNAIPHIWDLAGLINESDFTGEQHDEIIHRALAAEFGIEEEPPE